MSSYKYILSGWPLMRFTVGFLIITLNILIIHRIYEYKQTVFNQNSARGNYLCSNKNFELNGFDSP